MGIIGEKVTRNVNSGMNVVQNKYLYQTNNLAIMRVFALIISTFLTVFLLPSCSPYVNVVDIQTLNPSTATFTFAGKNVAIMGNLFYDDAQGKAYIHDSTLVAEAVIGIKEQLQQSPIFENYEIPVYYTYTADTSLATAVLSIEDIAGLTKDMSVEMIISVEYVGIDGEETGGSTLEHKMMYGGLFRVYEAGVEKPYSSYYFRSTEPESVMMFSENGVPILSTATEAKASLARQIGTSYAFYIAPYWESVQRVYYIGPDDEYGNISRGEKFADKGDWVKAMECWNKTISTSTKKMQVAMAAYNMAVGCEMMGDLNLAQDWLVYCKKQNISKVNPSSYIRIIEGRIQDKKNLDEKFKMTK